MSEYAQNFIAHLERLYDRDRGALAVLRRSLGFAPGTYVPAYPYVERFVAAERHAQDASRLALYLVAGLYAANPRQAEQSLATSLGGLMRLRDSASIEQRFIALLGADAENLAFYLRQIISLLAAGDQPLDYSALLQDVSLWLNTRIDSERRDAVRQRWARDFYRALTVSGSEKTPISAND